MPASARRCPSFFSIARGIRAPSPLAKPHPLPRQSPGARPHRVNGAGLASRLAPASSPFVHGHCHDGCWMGAAGRPPAWREGLQRRGRPRSAAAAACSAQPGRVLRAGRLPVWVSVKPGATGHAESQLLGSWGRGGCAVMQARPHEHCDMCTGFRARGVIAAALLTEAGNCACTAAAQYS